jgi:hypothetical protein
MGAIYRSLRARDLKNEADDCLDGESHFLRLLDIVLNDVSSGFFSVPVESHQHSDSSLTDKSAIGFTRSIAFWLTHGHFELGESERIRMEALITRPDRRSVIDNM